MKGMREKKRGKDVEIKREIVAEDKTKEAGLNLVLNLYPIKKHWTKRETGYEFIEGHNVSIM